MGDLFLLFGPAQALVQGHSLPFRQVESFVERGNVNHAAYDAGKSFPGGIQVDILIS